MCEEESDDAEAVNKLLVIDYNIHRTIRHYKLMQAGNIQEAHKIEKAPWAPRQALAEMLRMN